MFTRSNIAGLAALAALLAPAVGYAGVSQPWVENVVDSTHPKIPGATHTQAQPPLAAIPPNWVKVDSSVTIKQPPPRTAPANGAAATSSPSTPTTSGDVQGAFNPNQGAVIVGGVPITIIYPPQN